MSRQSVSVQKNPSKTCWVYVLVSQIFYVDSFVTTIHFPNTLYISHTLRIHHSHGIIVPNPHPLRRLAGNVSIPAPLMLLKAEHQQDYSVKSKHVDATTTSYPTASQFRGYGNWDLDEECRHNDCSDSIAWQLPLIKPWACLLCWGAGIEQYPNHRDRRLLP